MDLNSLIGTLSNLERGSGLLKKSSKSKNIEEFANTLVDKKKLTAGEILTPTKPTTPNNSYALSTTNSYQMIAETLLSSTDNLDKLDKKQLFSKTNDEKNEHFMDPQVAKFKEQWDKVHNDRIKLPLLRQLSPRTLRKLKLYPPLSHNDEKKFVEFDNIGKDMKSKGPILYDALNSTIINNREKQFSSDNTKHLYKSVSTNDIPTVYSIKNIIPSERDNQPIPEMNSNAFYTEMEARKMKSLNSKRRNHAHSNNLDTTSVTSAIDSCGSVSSIGDESSMYRNRTDNSSNDTTSAVIASSSKPLPISSYPFKTKLSNMIYGQGTISQLQSSRGQQKDMSYLYNNLSTEEETGINVGDIAVYPSMLPNESTLSSSMSGSMITDHNTSHKSLYKNNLSMNMTDTNKNSIQNTYEPMFNEVTTLANTIYCSVQQNLHVKLQNENKKMKSNRQHEQFLNQWRTGLLDDLGLDVDPNYNKYRTTKNSITVMFHYIRQCQLYIGMNEWKNWNVMYMKELKKRNIALINRVIRGHLARVRVHFMRLNIKLKQEYEAEVERQKQIFRQYMARKIQLCYRRYIRRKLMLSRKRQLAAAILIQARIRGCLGRARATWYRKYLKCRRASAIKIQTQWRMHMARRKLRLLRKLRFVCNWELEMKQKHSHIMWQHRTEGAALVIGACYRSYVIKSRLHTLIYWNHMKLAIDIQRVYRGYVVRKFFKRAILERRKYIALREAACIKLQSFFRMYLCRQRYYEYKVKKEILVMERRKLKKKLLKDKKLKLGEFKLNFSKIHRNLKKSLRSSIPFRYLFEKRKAILIQKYFRGHKARRRYLVLLVHKKVNEVIMKWNKREKAVINIQKTIRGFLYRRQMKKELWRRMATRIQCYWRRKMARKYLLKLQQREAALEILKDRFTAIVKGIRIRETFAHSQRYKQYVIRIQRLGRRYVARVKRRNQKDKLRLQADSHGNATLAAIRFLSSIQLNILVESLSNGIGQKPKDVWCGKDCNCYGPVQNIFVNINIKKKYTESDMLSSNRLDASSATKAILKIVEFTPENVKKWKLSNNNTNASSSALSSFQKSPNSSNGAKPYVVLTILEAIKLGLVKIPYVAKGVLGVDVDLLFNKCKVGGSNTLQYLEFTHFLDVLGVLALNIGTVSDTTTELKRLTSPSSPNRANSSAISDGMANSPFGIQIRSGSVAITKPKRDVKKKGKTETLSLSINQALQKFIYNSKHLITHRSSSALNVILYILGAACDTEPWYNETAEWIEKESRARASCFVIPIQNMVRRKLARCRIRHMIQFRSKKNHDSNQVLAATKIACGLRRFLARVKMTHVARKTIILYLPQKGQKYWYHPITKVTSYTKPKILKNALCHEIPLPASKLEYIITCSNCEIRPAKLNCKQCEDSFCQICYQTLHCKGKKLLHKYIEIVMCNICKFQMATKSCTSCSLRKPAKGSAEELVEGDRGLMCDNCYVHVHEKISSTHVTNGDQIVNTKEAYLVKGHIQQRLDTTHKYANLVQACEECSWRSGTYRCEQCDQVYCNLCLIGMHSLGGIFSSHKAERLPYYTPEMHIKYEKANFEQRLQKRIEKISQAYARRMNDLRTLSVIKLQSWWRMILGKRQGLQHMKEARLSQRRKWRFRRFETFQYRNSFFYHFFDVFGMAPELASDTTEERILKKFSVFSRERIRHYVYGNVEDWGYMTLKGKLTEEANAPKLRKGNPHIGFDVGTLDELNEQAKYGGYRLPGVALMTQGENQHVTSMDLSSLLKPGMIVRIRQSFFGIKDVFPTSITFNRKWRQATASDTVIYLVPCMNGQKYKRYYKFRHDLYDLVLGNAITQGTLESYRNTMLKCSRTSKNISVFFKRQGMLELSRKWQDRSNNYKIRSDWCLSMITRGIDTDLVDMQSQASGKSSKSGASTKKSAGNATISSDPAQLKLKSRRKEDRIPGMPWEATDEEIQENERRERNINISELAKEGLQWEMKYDAVKNVHYHFNTVTFQISYAVPGAVKARRQEEQDAEIKKQQYLETQKKIAKLNNQRNAKKSLSGNKR